MILLINTSDSKEVFLKLISGKKVINKKFNAQFKQSEKLLPEIDKLVPSINKLKNIAVVSGPGSFTALRIGVVVANTLAWSLNIPIIEITKDEFENESIGLKIKKAKKGSIVKPKYGKEPNITKKK